MEFVAGATLMLLSLFKYGSLCTLKPVLWTLNDDVPVNVLKKYKRLNSKE